MAKENVAIKALCHNDVLCEIHLSTLLTEEPGINTSSQELKAMLMTIGKL